MLAETGPTAFGARRLPLKTYDPPSDRPGSITADQQGELSERPTAAQLAAVPRVTGVKHTELGRVWSAHSAISTFS
jgi:hypothetical protein